MSEPYTKEEIDAFRGEVFVMHPRDYERWLATYDAIQARVARLEEALEPARADEMRRVLDAVESHALPIHGGAWSADEVLDYLHRLVAHIEDDRKKEAQYRCDLRTLCAILKEKP